MSRWERVQQIFEAVADLPESERATQLDELCGSDEALRQEVASLLRFDGTPSGFERAVEETAAALDGPELTHAGPYRLVREIGRGGMGAVYLAVRDDDEFQREVAVKLVKRGMDTHAIVQRFRTERQILALLEHPRIARLYDGGSTVDGRPFLVMEYVPGEPLVAYSQKRALPVSERLQLFRQVCEGVEQAHRRLIIHRDLKPSNILVADGQVKLLDFGIAKLLDTDAQHTMAMTGMRMLTPEYASPEQVRGEPITTATDIYALGTVLYELLTYKPAHPLAGNSLEELERVVCGGLRPVTGLSDELDHIVQMAMRLEPERRYASVTHLSDDVGRYLEQRPVLARPDTIGYRASKFVRRHRGMVAAAVLVLFTLIAGIAGTAWQARRANENARRAEERFAQVRHLANVFLFEIEPRIRTLPGSTEAREMLARTATEYLDSLAREASGDAGLQLELANAYLRVGDVQGYGGQANLGKPQYAQESYRKGIALLEALRAGGKHTPEMVLSLARLQQRLSDAAGRTSRSINAREHRQRALELVREYRRSKPLDDAGRTLELEVLASLSGDWISRGQFEKALGYLKQAEALVPAWIAGKSEPETQGMLAVLTYRQAAALVGLGRLAAGAEAMRRSVAMREAMVRRDPLNSAYGGQLLRDYHELAGMLGDPDEENLGLYDEALAYCQKAVALGESLQTADPNSSYAPTNLAYVLGGMGRIYCQLGKPQLALPHFDRAVQIKRQVSARDPGNHAARIDLGTILTDRAIAHRMNREWQREIDDLRESIAIHTKIAEARAQAANMRQNRILPMMYLAVALARRGDRAQAVQVFTDALSLADTIQLTSRPDFRLFHKSDLLMEAAAFFGGSRGCELRAQALPYLQELEKRKVSERRWKAHATVARRPCR